MSSAANWENLYDDRVEARGAGAGTQQALILGLDEFWAGCPTKKSEQNNREDYCAMVGGDAPSTPSCSDFTGGRVKALVAGIDGKLKEQLQGLIKQDKLSEDDEKTLLKPENQKAASVLIMQELIKLAAGSDGLKGARAKALMDVLAKLGKDAAPALFLAADDGKVPEALRTWANKQIDALAGKLTGLEQLVDSQGNVRRMLGVKAPGEKPPLPEAVEGHPRIRDWNNGYDTFYSADYVDGVLQRVDTPNGVYSRTRVKGSPDDNPKFEYVRTSQWNEKPRAYANTPTIKLIDFAGGKWMKIEFGEFEGDMVVMKR